VTTLVRSGHPQDSDLDALRARAADLEAGLRDRTAEIDRAKADLAAFKIRYRQEVGRLHEQLDELELALAEAELGEINKRLDGAADPPGSASSAPEADAAPRLTTDAIRRLFRDVAKTIHPDLAEDDLARGRRHALMVEANRAYAVGDEERLRLILQAWENSPETVPGDDPEAARLRLLRRIAQIERELDACAADLAALKDSPLGKLKAMVDESAKRGTNLIRDMVRRLERDILVARNRLDAMRGA
jgi:hypothetical protein